ncbi:MAG: hypothetical protein COV91_06285 [Candidatus Taylorbacteria bacterium CG11_big_fil_rev_8_21_14_0_20_46_11]|uniref:PAS domain-containing protein n=1 Tax=Candidatus Taylorbacteria bacterium CG11_big_fil_rev_8_21_14_0_20_46_11 TaxID=1975025 RepID=A0A2H0K9U2_9BACT|nr:MAG: hypothetical protein COV91_06285 [Candidatus Taylorbacteria bacterium CG11_big_fil_rev_8_21_14_0_20_46_11]
MEQDNKVTEQTGALVWADFVNHFWEKSWTHVKTVVDVAHEPVLLLDKSLSVIAANESFYRSFQVEPKDTEKKLVYELGSGQWNIPALRRLLGGILPKNSFFKGFEVVHEFPSIGRRVMILNAREIHVQDDVAFPPTILLAIEDVTEMMMVAESFANHTKQVGTELTEQARSLETRMGKVEKELHKLVVKV